MAPRAVLDRCRKSPPPPPPSESLYRLSYSGPLCAYTHTHTHTHIYIYTYIQGIRTTQHYVRKSTYVHNMHQQQKSLHPLCSSSGYRPGSMRITESGSLRSGWLRHVVIAMWRMSKGEKCVTVHLYCALFRSCTPVARVIWVTTWKHCLKIPGVSRYLITQFSGKRFARSLLGNSTDARSREKVITNCYFSLFFHMCVAETEERVQRISQEQRCSVSVVIPGKNRRVGAATGLRPPPPQTEIYETKIL